jgi:hypothetical protein
MTQWNNRLVAALTRRPFLLFVTLYLAIAGLALFADRVLPDEVHRAIASLTGGAGLGATDNGAFVRGRPMGPPPVEPMWIIGTVAMVAGGLLALPVAWLYTITRQKRGYRQSMVQTLILLPVVVAGVVVLVKFSLALAFSLAGIVAAVRFRNTLEDSKDAVYIFVVTGIGLAAGVELSAAAALSVVFNLTTLLLFQSDFGRTPARLEGNIAEERMQRALSMANRKSQFVARLDAEILEGMAPEQLEAVADRAWQRRREAAPGPEDETRGRMDSVLRVRTTDVTAMRATVEGLLESQAKRWQFERAEGDVGGEQLLTWALKLKKSVQPTAFVDGLRAAGGTLLLHVELK